MPQRQCTKTEADITSPCKRITLPITLEKYSEIIGDCYAYREWVDEMIVQHEELFPDAIRDGYRLHDERGSDTLFLSKQTPNLSSEFKQTPFLS
jgi:hypothetical protein